MPFKWQDFKDRWNIFIGKEVSESTNYIELPDSTDTYIGNKTGAGATRSSYTTLKYYQDVMKDADNVILSANLRRSQTMPFEDNSEILQGFITKIEQIKCPHCHLNMNPIHVASGETFTLLAHTFIGPGTFCGICYKRIDNV